MGVLGIIEEKLLQGVIYTPFHMFDHPVVRGHMCFLNCFNCGGKPLDTLEREPLAQVRGVMATQNRAHRHKYNTRVSQERGTRKAPEAKEDK
eukprot:4380153-Amphidinium_carterae.1